MKKTALRLAGAGLALALAFGCAPPSGQEEEGLALWFPTDPALDAVSAALGSCPYEGEDRSIPGLLSALLAGPPPEEAALASLIPEGTRVLSWSVADRVANVELSAAYAELVGVDLTLTDCCITLTLAQLPEVDGVRITVNGGGQSYRERQALYPDDVLLTGEEEAPVELTAALYFRRGDADRLGFELRRLRLARDGLPAKAALSALIAGPEDRGLSALLPAELVIHSVRVEGGLCTADLSAQLLELPEEARRLAASSIVETLCGLDGVERVLILVDGRPVGAFGGLDLSEPLRGSAQPVE